MRRLRWDTLLGDFQDADGSKADRNDQLTGLAQMYYEF